MITRKGLDFRTGNTMGDRQDISSVISMWRSARQGGRLAQTLSETPIDVLALAVSRLIDESVSVDSTKIEAHFLSRFRGERWVVVIQRAAINQETGQKERTAVIEERAGGSREAVSEVPFRMELPGDVKLACGTLRPFYEALYYDILNEIDDKGDPPFEAVPSHTTRLDKLVGDERFDEIERDYG